MFRRRHAGFARSAGGDDEVTRAARRSYPSAVERSGSWGIRPVTPGLLFSLLPFLVCLRTVPHVVGARRQAYDCHHGEKCRLSRFHSRSLRRFITGFCAGCAMRMDCHRPPSPHRTTVTQSNRSGRGPFPEPRSLLRGGARHPSCLHSAHGRESSGLFADDRACLRRGCNHYLQGLRSERYQGDGLRQAPHWSATSQVPVSSMPGKALPSLFFAIVEKSMLVPISTLVS
jgi:hypothetical protein